jgi:hypothetical protein
MKIGASLPTICVTAVVTWAALLAVEPSARAGAGPEKSQQPELEDFSGTWVMLQQTVTVAELPVIADVEATTRAVSLMHLVHEDDRLVGEGPLCALTLDSTSSLVTMELPDAFRRALPPVQLDAKLTRREGKLAFHQSPRTLVVGAKVEPNTPLPSDAKDKRVIDQDRDGKPGVTVRVSGIVSGEIYLVQRNTSRLYGARRGPAFTGRIEFSTEQRVLATTNPWLGDGPTSRPVPSKSFFRLERLKGEGGCAEAELVARRWH